MIAVLRALWELVTGLIADFLEWLREPGSLPKLGCILLFLGCCYLAWESDNRADALRAKESELVVARSKWEQKKVLLEAEIDGKQEALDRIAETTAAERAQLITLMAQNKALLTRLGQAQAEADAYAKRFANAYSNRGAACSAAINTLASSCSGLKGY